MDFLEWATNPWGQVVPIHIAWFLIWVAVIAGLLFLIVHATWLKYFAKEKQFASEAPRRPLRESPGACLVIRWWLACFIGSWLRPCSRSCLPLSSRRWA